MREGPFRFFPFKAMGCSLRRIATDSSLLSVDSIGFSTIVTFSCCSHLSLFFFVFFFYFSSSSSSCLLAGDEQLAPIVHARAPPEPPSQV